MVNLKRIENKLLELECFFEYTLDNTSQIDISSYGAGASYGLNTIRNMKITLNKYMEKPQNKLLKLLDNGFNSVTRGVEGFNNDNLNENFREVSIGIYEIREELNAYLSDNQLPR
ncbi:hypothetical protein DHD05_03230 [Arenibacter sp. N53]|uniref:hypothetical protein n=1 Tax=Arenibacter TaxID=178469 RepID=UPI000CD3BD0E|nr:MULTISPECIES: hypothetical protein [Arenibacter]MCM4150593.1 hypothetical protein [Arenibacter sp. N53]